jgi:hypothetical protein
MVQEIIGAFWKDTYWVHPFIFAYTGESLLQVKQWKINHP